MFSTLVSLEILSPVATPEFTENSWRIAFMVVGMVIGMLTLAIVLLPRLLPESPCWLITHGCSEEAEAIVASMEEDARRRGADLPHANRVELFQPATTIRGVA